MLIDKGHFEEIKASNAQRKRPRSPYLKAPTAADSLRRKPIISASSWSGPLREYFTDVTRGLAYKKRISHPQERI